MHAKISGFLPKFLFAKTLYIPDFTLIGLGTLILFGIRFTVHANFDIGALLRTRLGLIIL